jgi:hypothetical protein
MPEINFFISYASEDQNWAEWIAWHLEKDGYTTRLQSWDFSPGRDFIHEMQESVGQAQRIIAVLSPAYAASKYAEAEWRTAFAKDPTGELRLLIPVRVATFTPPGLLATRVYIDLVGLDEAVAAEKLCDGVREDKRLGRPDLVPPFPGKEAAAVLPDQPPFPGTGLPISDLVPGRPLRPRFDGIYATQMHFHDGLKSRSYLRFFPTGEVASIAILEGPVPGAPLSASFIEHSPEDHALSIYPGDGASAVGYFSTSGRRITLYTEYSDGRRIDEEGWIGPQGNKLHMEGVNETTGERFAVDYWFYREPKCLE